jgi:hypothetical protein
VTVWPDGFPQTCGQGHRPGGRLRGSCVHSAARRFDGFGLTPATRSAAYQKIGIDLEQAHSGQVLAGLHVVDPPDHQVARGLVDVEQLRACGHFADTVDHLAVDAGDLRARQALLEQGCNRRILRRWRGGSALERHGGKCPTYLAQVQLFKLHAISPHPLMNTPSRKTISTSIPVGISITG